MRVQGDAVRVVTDGFNRFVISDEIRPHTASMSRENSQQVINDGAGTLVVFDTKRFDVGGIADTATGQFTLRRAGRYPVTVRGGVVPPGSPPVLFPRRGRNKVPT